jgi:hypothetical protein
MAALTLFVRTSDRGLDKCDTHRIDVAVLVLYGVRCGVGVLHTIHSRSRAGYAPVTKFGRSPRKVLRPSRTPNSARGAFALDRENVSHSSKKLRFPAGVALLQTAVKL